MEHPLQANEFKGVNDMPPTAKQFEDELDGIFALAQKRGESRIEVKSGDLHRRVGGYPAHNNRMPVCCTVMKRKMKPGDQVLQEPPSGQGATLVIRYRLPR